MRQNEAKTKLSFKQRLTSTTFIERLIGCNTVTQLTKPKAKMSFHLFPTQNGLYEINT